jgi:eukaryotic-like serine/threonine-protein kinase
MRILIFLLALASPFFMIAQDECKTAEECFQRGLRTLFDKEKLAYQNECFTKAIKLDPNYMEAYHYRGGNFYKQSLHKEALKDYNKYIALMSKNKKPSKYMLAKVYYQRAETHTKLNKSKEALADFKKAAELMPKEEKYITAFNTAKTKK